MSEAVPGPEAVPPPDASSPRSASSPQSDWHIFTGGNRPHDRIRSLPPPPPWRDFGGTGSTGDRRPGDVRRARSYRTDESVVDKVNAALQLRRPLLVTGKPGSGKSTLAYSIAYELGLGPVLNWPITSRSTLQQGLYHYDAIGRVHEASLRGSGPAWAGPAVPQAVDGETGAASDAAADVRPDAPGIGRYIRLGPLGTALLPGDLPRVLLIDELDKSDIDLPNDLLNIFEEGWFLIPELERLPEDQPVVEVMTAGEGRASIERGRVACADFPIVVITSNGEREFPPAFLRRCVRVAIEPPNGEHLAEIVEAHLGEPARREAEELIRDFLARRAHGDLATDQLLNAIFLATSGARPPESGLADLVDTILRPLGIPGSK
ncbi:MoxR family ATPase [Spirillospora sp. NPDC048819]|uniref:AAA family ATPase n=1 Tax=Spirillospora sp. NPDC048819 TaxID=3155268 RepID=UPI0033FCC338